MATVMGLYALVTTIAYLVNKNPIFHEVMYGILVFALITMQLRLNTIQKSNTCFRVSLAGFFM